MVPPTNEFSFSGATLKLVWERGVERCGQRTCCMHRMSSQRAGETRFGGSEEDLSQMEMEEYATEAEKKFLVDRQVRSSSRCFG